MMQCDMFFIDRLVAMDPIMQFLSSTNMDSSGSLWEDNQYVSPPEEQETGEVHILQDTSQVKAKGRKSRTKKFLKTKTSFYVSHGWKLAWMMLGVMNNIGPRTGRESMSTTTSIRPLNLHIL
jgi:hypothetical protein